MLRYLILFVSFIAIVGCAQAPATSSPQQSGQQRAGQGDNNVNASAADAQSGIGAEPNRHGALASGDSEVVVSDEGNSRTITVRGGVRTLIVGNEIEYSPSASATVSGTTSGTDQAQTGSQDATQTPTATSTPETNVDLNLTPGN